MWPDRVSKAGPLTYESDALPTALRGPASCSEACNLDGVKVLSYVSLPVVALSCRTSGQSVYM